MAKKSEIIGEYILTINYDNSVNVSMIPDNTKDELRKIAEKNNIAYDDKLTTHQLGALILKELGKPGENTLILGEYEIEKEPGGRINLLKSYGNTKEGLRQISEQIGFEYNKEWNTQQFGHNLMNFIVKRDEEVATTPGNFVVNTTTTVGDLNKQFQSTYGGYLKIYNGRSVAKEDEKLVDIGAKTGEFSCRANRTVGSFVEAMKETFGLKVKVWTSDEWVTVLDGITLSKVRDLPKQATKAVLEAYESYKRENKEDSNLNNIPDTSDIEDITNNGEELLEEEETIPAAFEEIPDYEMTTHLPSVGCEEDGIPVVKINLVATKVSSYDDAWEKCDEWGGEGVLIVSNSRDFARYPFDKISYLEVSIESVSTKIENFHSEFEEDCKDALRGGYIIFQDTDDEFPDEVWQNTELALDIIFHPEHSSAEFMNFECEEYEGPEAIFVFNVYWIRDWMIPSYDERRKSIKPFYEARYRVFKNDDDEWTSEKLD